MSVAKYPVVSHGSRWPVNTNPIKRRNSNTPDIQTTSRGLLYAFMRKTLNIWINRHATRRFEDHEWIDRISQP
jgi:hypothetical protein